MQPAKPAMMNFDSQSRLAAVVRELKRMIHMEGIRVGGRLPTQEKLREIKGFHNNTLNSAMNVLIQHGVLTRKRKVGTLVMAPHNPIPGLWRVGLLLAPGTAEEMFYAQLLNFMQTHLQNAGADILVFMLRRNAVLSKLGLADYEHLAEACSADRLDGLLTPIALSGEDWQALHERGLEVAHAGAWEEAPAGVVIEHEKMVEDAVARLLSAGCRRLGTVSIGGPKPSFRHFWDSFCRATAAAGLDESSAQSFHGGHGPFGGWRVAETLLEMPAGQRPDGLIVLDDRVATGLTAVLATSSYRPRCAVQTNRQAPLAFALPVMHYEVDVEELAKLAVDNLMQRLLIPNVALRRDYLYPKLHSATPERMMKRSAKRQSEEESLRLLA